MRKVTFVFLAIFIAICLFNGKLYAAEKIGYVNLSKIFNEYSKTKEYDKKLEGKQKAYEGEREKKANEIKKLQDKLVLLNEKQKEKKTKEIEGKIRSFQEYDTNKRLDLRNERDEKIREILEYIEETIRKYAKAQGYTLVFNDRVLVYQDKGNDITDAIIALVNKKK
ncbi:MAG TPA: OmpH family outer membrane protein [Candidatus Omnitrophica bacterium]|nr:OmpH family outer membrane protein [Candidatus Omnitrophota bacterium]